MITNKDILKALPMAARMKAYKNSDKGFLNSPACSRGVPGVLSCAFVWVNTKQGNAYWRDIYNGS